jgi:hypothetical protein
MVTNPALAKNKPDEEVPVATLSMNIELEKVKPLVQEISMPVIPVELNSVMKLQLFDSHSTVLLP